MVAEENFVNRIYHVLFVCLFVSDRKIILMVVLYLKLIVALNALTYFQDHTYVALDLATSHENKIHVQQELRK